MNFNSKDVSCEIQMTTIAKYLSEKYFLSDVATNIYLIWYWFWMINQMRIKQNFIEGKRKRLPVTFASLIFLIDVILVSLLCHLILLSWIEMLNYDTELLILIPYSVVLFSLPTMCKIVNTKQKCTIYYVASMSVWTTISVYLSDNSMSKIITANVILLWMSDFSLL